MSIENEIKQIIEKDLDKLKALLSLSLTSQFDTRPVTDAWKNGVKGAKAFGSDTVKNNTNILRIGTGNLANSFFKELQLKVTNNQVEGEIGSNVVYANIHEHGSSRMPKRPYFAPFIEDMNERRLKDWWEMVEEDIDDWLNSTTINV